MKRLLTVASLMGIGMGAVIDLTKMELCTTDADCQVFGDTRAYCNIIDATKYAFNGEITTDATLVAGGAGNVGQCTCGTYTAAEGLSFGAYNNIAHCFPTTEAAAVTNARSLLVSLNMRYSGAPSCNTKSYLADFESETRAVITRHTTGMQMSVSCGTRYEGINTLYITISANMTIGEIIANNFLQIQDTLEGRYQFNSMYFYDPAGALATGTVEFHAQPAMFLRCPDTTNTTYWGYHGSFGTTYPPIPETDPANHIITTQRCVSHACVTASELVNGDCFTSAVPVPSDDDLSTGAIAAIAIICSIFVCCIVCIIVWCCCFRNKYHELPEEKE
eukprot:TRINITY_DN22932_c0_g1_i1.p1 TRINITY_DN22932_c0_g1~~TRINITY_DN22932_c0_g1_i1.p1  ORF type:complete len:352 (+),score=50.35 TRINITY_DN22932_c0_g1_i1:58-1056(+)